MMWRAIVILLKPPMGSTASVNQTFLIRALTRDLVSKNEDQVGESWRSYGLEVLGEGDSAGGSAGTRRGRRCLFREHSHPGHVQSPNETYGTSNGSKDRKPT